MKLPILRQGGETRSNRTRPPLPKEWPVGAGFPRPKTYARVLIALCLLALTAACPAQAPDAATAKAQIELNALYDTMQRAYQDKKPDAILALWAPNYSRTAYGADGTLNRKESEAILRSQFPGNQTAPHHRFFIQALTLLKGGKIAVASVKDFASQPDTDNTSDPHLNTIRQFLWDHTWLKTAKGWRLEKQEPAK